MDTTMEKIAEKLDPTPYVDSAADWAKEKAENLNGGAVKDGAKAVSDTVRNNPIPVALAGLAVASLFLPKRSKNQTEGNTDASADREPQNPLTSVGMANAPKVDRINERVYDPTTREITPTNGDGSESSKRERIANTARDLKDSLTGTSATAGKKLSAAREKAGETFGNVSAAARERTSHLRSESSARFQSGKENYPALMGLGAVAVGFLAALAIPRTRKENELYGDKADQLKAKAAEKRNEFTEEAKEKIHEKGLDPESLKEKACDAVNEAAEKVEEKIEAERPE